MLAAFLGLGLVLVMTVALERESSQALEHVLDDRADAVISSADSASSHTRLAVPDSHMDPGAAVYDRSGALVAGSEPPSLGEQFRRLAAVTGEQHTTVDEDYQLLARPFTTSGGAAGVVVIAESTKPFEQHERMALIVSAAAAVAMVGLALLLAAWSVRRALEPVEQMAATARAWSEYDLDRRFALGAPSDEIRALAATLDGLLDKVGGAIRAEQRLTSELAHELRTPLTAIQGTADLMSMRQDLEPELREDVEDIRASSRAMAATITVLLEVARGSRTSTDESCSGIELAEAIRQAHPASGIDMDLPPDGRVAVPLPLVMRCVGPLLDNAVAVSTRVRVVWRKADEGDSAEIVVSDEGPGVDPAVADRLFTPGASTRGSGLGLALARRVARSVGGDVEHRGAGRPDGSGAVFAVRLPAMLNGSPRSPSGSGSSRSSAPPWASPSPTG